MVVTLKAPQDALCAWLTNRLQYVATPNMTCLGSYDTSAKEILGVVGYDNWTSASVEMYAAGEKQWLTREFLQKAFLYPFMIGGVEVILCRIDSGNTRSLTFTKKLGFLEACRIPRAGEDGRDMAIVTMHREDCRWIHPLKSKLREAA